MNTDQRQQSTAKVPTFTQHVEELRIKNKISVRKMADILEIDRDTYRRRVSGSDGLGEKALMLAAKYFGFTVIARGKEIQL